MKLERLARKWVVTEKSRGNLLGSTFTVLPDNNPLCHLSTAKLEAFEHQWRRNWQSFIVMPSTDLDDQIR